MGVAKKQEGLETLSEERAFAENMRREREARGWSQSALAETLRLRGLTNFHPTTVSRVENGDRPVSLHEALVIAEVFLSDVIRMTRPKFEAVEAVQNSWRHRNVLLNKALAAEDELRRLERQLHHNKHVGLMTIDLAEEQLKAQGAQADAVVEQLGPYRERMEWTVEDWRRELKSGMDEQDVDG